MTGTATPCQSANLPRSIERVDFSDDDPEDLGFSLIADDFKEEVYDFDVDENTRELVYDKVKDLTPNVSLF